MTLNSSRDTNNASRNYHLVGVGGVGMSALAQLLLALGYQVSGSDRYHDQGRELDILKKLRSLGVKMVAQDGCGIKENTDAVVVSTAIENDNQDVAAARLKKIPVVHRAEMLASLAREKQCVAVTGTAGKSTVTGMIGWTLVELGLDPTVVNGAAVLNWVSGQNPGNFRFGRSSLWVLELDESDRSLLNFYPEWAVVTNISKDHFELAEVEKLFALFARQVKKDIIGPGFSEASPKASSADTHYDTLNRAVTKKPDFNPSLSQQGIEFCYKDIKFRLSLLGKHNAENALNCVMLCERLGLDLGMVSKALSKFAGIERRLEVAGRVCGITVIDDYAHSPAKIAAAWQAIAPFYHRIIAVWRPHGYGPLALMHRELMDVFTRLVRPEDRIVIMSVYFAGGTAEKKVTARMLAEDMTQNNLPVSYVENYDELLALLLKSAADGDAVLLMGARDPDLPVFVRGLVLKFNDFIMNRMPGAGGITQKDKPAEKAEDN